MAQAAVISATNTDAKAAECWASPGGCWTAWATTASKATHNPNLAPGLWYAPEDAETNRAYGKMKRVDQGTKGLKN